MNTSKTIEAIDHNRRRLLGMAAMGITVAGAGSLLPSQLAAAPAGDTIRPFRVHYRKNSSPICAGASPPRVGRTRRPSMTDRRVPSSQNSKR